MSVIVTPARSLTIPKTRRRRRRKNTLALHLMLLPAVILTLIYKYGAMFGVIIAFQQFSPVKGIQGSPFIGLDNFRFALNLPMTERVVQNTLIIAIGKIAIGLIAPLITALMLNDLNRNWSKRTIQTAIYLPHFLSW